MGHAFSYSQAEFIARYRRMAGFEVFYPFGFDDNGLATEKLAEKVKQVRASQMPREDFVKLCLEVTKKYEEEFEQIWKSLGISCDWSLLYRTISKDVQKLSQTNFLRLYKKGRIYRKQSPSLYCPECRTAIAQVELEDQEFDTTFNDIQFPFAQGEGKLIISTTRPELLGSCVCVFVNPNDERYKNLIGKKLKVPIFNQVVEIKQDEKVDKEKGTGAVMCCTFGDQQDIEWFRKYNLPLRISIDYKGTLTDLAGPYQGLKVKDARQKIIEDLKQQGFLTNQRQIKHSVNVHERCKSQIEFLVSNQWFIKWLDIKKQLLKAGKKINWHPRHFFTRYKNWLEGLSWDWCISRQRYFGVPFPVWYCNNCKEIILADEKDLPIDPLIQAPKQKCTCGSQDFTPEKDVLDTWATSSLTPLINAKWSTKQEKTYKKIYPMTLRPNAHDIITFWDFNTIATCLMQTNKIPFQDIMISGWGLDPKGQRMSKSLGNVVKPQEIIQKYSADAVRWWASGVKLGEDLWYKEEDIKQGIKFAIKIYNVAKFVELSLGQNYKHKKAPPKTLHKTDKWLLTKLNKVIKESTNSFENYEYSKAKTASEQFFYSDFCDNYLEMVKYRIYDQKNQFRQSALWTLYHSLLTMLKLFAPFTPFITEELYQQLFAKQEKTKSIHISNWPKQNKNLNFKKEEQTGNSSVLAISEIRKYKNSRSLSLGAELDHLTLQIGSSYYDQINKNLEELQQVTRVKKIDVSLSKDDETAIKVLD